MPRGTINYKLTVTGPDMERFKSASPASAGCNSLPEIGNRLRQLREQNDLSYGQLSKRTGISKSLLHRMERGANFEILTLVKILNALEADIKTVLC